MSAAITWLEPTQISSDSQFDDRVRVGPGDQMLLCCRKHGHKERFLACTMVQTVFMPSRLIRMYGQLPGRMERTAHKLTCALSRQCHASVFGLLLVVYAVATNGCRLTTLHFQSCLLSLLSRRSGTGTRQRRGARRTRSKRARQRVSKRPTNSKKRRQLSLTRRTSPQSAI